MENRVIRDIATLFLLKLIVKSTSTFGMPKSTWAADNNAKVKANKTKVVFFIFQFFKVCI
ncbi:MAG: hypothetical protein GY870_09035 [archaeon]|nr:hypothetical protein [archaeon]